MAAKRKTDEETPAPESPIEAIRAAYDETAEAVADACRNGRAHGLPAAAQETIFRALLLDGVERIAAGIEDMAAALAEKGGAA